MGVWRHRLHSECPVNVRNHIICHCTSSLGLNFPPERLYNFLHSSFPLTTGASLNLTHQSKSDVLALDLKCICQLLTITLIALLCCFVNLFALFVCVHNFLIYQYKPTIIRLCFMLFNDAFTVIILCIFCW
jgi:hypothetical protein